jgi:hypothetical protein
VAESPASGAEFDDEARRRLTDLLAAELAAASDRALAAGAEARSLVRQIEASLRRLRRMRTAQDAAPQTPPRSET